MAAWPTAEINLRDEADAPTINVLASQHDAASRGTTSAAAAGGAVEVALLPASASTLSRQRWILHQRRDERDGREHPIGGVDPWITV